MSNEFNNEFENHDFKEFEFNTNSNSINYSGDEPNFNSDSRVVDVRIILTNLNYMGFISKAVSDLDLSNFNVVISSIIPIIDVNIAKNAVIGSDLVLIAIEPTDDGKSIYNKFKKELKNDYNFIEYLKLPSLENYGDYNYSDENSLEEEISNSIIRGGLYSISNISLINQIKFNYSSIKKEFDKNIVKCDKLIKENDFLINESSKLRESNEKLNEEVKILQKQLDLIKSNFSDFKTRFESIRSRNSLEVFSLFDLWQELFSEELSESIYNSIICATDNFRPTNIFVGQGVISAQSKDDALDWLKIIKTSFILINESENGFNFNNLKNDNLNRDISNSIIYSRNDDFGNGFDMSVSIDDVFDGIDEFSDEPNISLDNPNHNSDISSNIDDVNSNMESHRGYSSNHNHDSNSNTNHNSNHDSNSDDVFDDFNVFNLKNSLKSIDKKENLDSNDNNSVDGNADDISDDLFNIWE